MPTGFIYVLSNVSMPGLVKIGRTDRTLEQRISQLNTTGVPTPFILEHSVTTSNSVMAEREIHAALAARGVRNTGNREFFKMDVNKAKQVVTAIAGLYPEDDENWEDDDDAAYEAQERLDAEARDAKMKLLEKRFDKAPRPAPNRYIEECQAIQYETEFKEIAELGFLHAYKELGKLFSRVCPSKDKWKLYERAYLNKLLDPLAGNYPLDALNDEDFKFYADILSDYYIVGSRKNWLDEEDCEYVSSFIRCLCRNGNIASFEFFIDALNKSKIRDVDIIRAITF